MVSAQRVRLGRSFPAPSRSALAFRTKVAAAALGATPRAVAVFIQEFDAGLCQRGDDLLAGWPPRSPPAASRRLVVGIETPDALQHVLGDSRGPRPALEAAAGREHELLAVGLWRAVGLCAAQSFASTLAIVSASADTSIFVSLNEVPHPAKW